MSDQDAGDRAGGRTDGVEYGLDDWADDANEDPESTTLQSAFGTESASGSGAALSAVGENPGYCIAAGALLGAIVSFPLSVIGTAAGGALAGNLRGADGATGAKLGAVAGALSTVPGAILGLGTGETGRLVLEGIGTGIDPVSLVLGLLLWLVLLVVGGLVAALIGAAGGYVGARADPIQQTVFGASPATTDPPVTDDGNETDS